MNHQRTRTLRRRNFRIQRQITCFFPMNLFIWSKKMLHTYYYYFFWSSLFGTWALQLSCRRRQFVELCLAITIPGKGSESRGEQDIMGPFWDLLYPLATLLGPLPGKLDQARLPHISHVGYDISCKCEYRRGARRKQHTDTAAKWYCNHDNIQRQALQVVIPQLFRETPTFPLSHPL